MTFVLSSKKAYSIIRIFLGIVFIISGGLKLLDIRSFAQIIDAFAILPDMWITPTAIFIPVIELMLGMALTADIRGSLAGVLVLLIVFSMVLAWALFMGYDIDCGCFGPNDPEAKAFAAIKTSLARDVIMIGMIGYLYVWRMKNNHIPRFLNFKKI